jgi:tetratricopeptide (TPR) repeat protein
MPEDESPLQQTLSLLRSGNAKKALQTFRPVLRYPGQVEHPTEFAEALQVLAEISVQIGETAFATQLRNAAHTPTDVKQLYQVGYEMIEHGLSDMAATVLAYAHRLQPDNPAVLNELSAALEKQMLYAEARRFLQQAPDLVQHNFLTCYLLAFNSLMCGDLETSQQLLPDLQRLHSQHASFPQMTGRIATLLARADALKGHTPLDTCDLRGWHLVLTGGLLLHLSPYGFDEPMHGRYAWVQDSYGLCLLGILRVQAVLDTLQLRPPCLWMLPDRNSQILAHAAARVLDPPLKPWPTDGSQAPGLIVAYDLSQLDRQTLVSVRNHHPGQILWSHATCWTESQPLSADLTTFLYQTGTQPWGEQLTVDPESRQTTRRPADQRDPTRIAADLITANPAESLPEDEPTLLTLARIAARAEVNVLALLREEGQRQKQWAGSPVPGSLFR